MEGIVEEDIDRKAVQLRKMLAGDVMGRSMEDDGPVDARTHRGTLHHCADVVRDQEHGHPVFLIKG